MEEDNDDDFYLLLIYNICNISGCNRLRIMELSVYIRLEGIATDYGLNGPGSNPGGDDIFRPSRPALGPTQAPVQ